MLWLEVLQFGYMAEFGESLEVHKKCFYINAVRNLGIDRLSIVILLNEIKYKVRQHYKAILQLRAFS
ncbi:hypothetical protein ACFO8Q_04415 [Effusibacillus consociatus]|uniref:Uncharacterized protein n=1 Tax=Effusibacillus consociatus TaxID=1117041 RepID=A0ABV9Q080_9BACL